MGPLFLFLCGAFLLKLGILTNNVATLEVRFSLLPMGSGRRYATEFPSNDLSGLIL